jgi:hypothetical protein
VCPFAVLLHDSTIIEGRKEQVEKGTTGVRLLRVVASDSDRWRPTS